MSAGDFPHPSDTDDTIDYVRPAPRPSPYYEDEPRLRATVRVAARTHPGMVRPNNEDQYLAVQRYRGRRLLASSVPAELLDMSEDHAYALAVADGMGGRNFGELASLLAVRMGWELGGDEVKWSLKMNDDEADELRHKADEFFRRLDQAIHAEVRESPRLAGMGTTMTVCYSTGPELFVMHVGDSRAYLHRHGRLHRLTRDHNIAQILIDSGAARPGSPEARKMAHVLTNVLGGPGGGVEVEVHHHQLLDRDRLLLCTDGLTDPVPDDEIARLLGEHDDPDAAAQALLGLALDRGAKDNVTLIVADYRIGRDEGSDASERTVLPG